MVNRFTDIKDAESLGPEDKIMAYFVEYVSRLGRAGDTHALGVHAVYGRETWKKACSRNKSRTYEEQIYRNK